MLSFFVHKMEYLLPFLNEIRKHYLCRVALTSPAFLARIESPSGHQSKAPDNDRNPWPPQAPGLFLNNAAWVPSGDLYHLRSYLRSHLRSSSPAPSTFSHSVGQGGHLRVDLGIFERPCTKRRTWIVQADTARWPVLVGVAGYDHR